MGRRSTHDTLHTVHSKFPDIKALSFLLLWFDASQFYPYPVGLFHWHGPFTRYVKSRVVHASGMPGTFSPPPNLTETGS